MTIDEQIAADKAERHRLAAATHTAFLAAEALIEHVRRGELSDFPELKALAARHDAAMAAASKTPPRL